MTTRRKKVLLASYLIGIAITFVQAFLLYAGKDANFILTMIGTILVIVPWGMCLFDAAKLRENGLLWFFFIFFVIGIGTPVYLLNSLSKEKK